MALFGSRRRGRTPSARALHKRGAEHLRQWAETRRGVEAFIEPKTSVTESTLVLVAYDGEWTRRRVADPESAFDLCRRLGIPVYDVALVGYPARMRTYTERQNRERRHQGS